ncbi:MAG TPA: pyridoxal-phosphate dependent enzyme [Candidatus Dormibacteraeota bacterium]|nr:pyridoxal-phosphate dependent enzyme [Candidatus Dormibacteraeota bacterium]
MPRGLLLPSPALLPAGSAARGLLAVESLNAAGSFKLRGAVAAVAALPRGRRVVTSSAGNHGLGVALAAAAAGSPATVVVSVHADPAKVAAIRRTGCELVLHGDAYEEAERHALALAERTGAAFVSPYNDPSVIAGQATVGRELVEELGEDLTIVVPVGGGGLAAGVALTAGGAVTVGAEAERSPAMSSALRAGRVTPIEVGPTLADALAGNLEPGTVTFPLIRDHVEAVLTVSETEIAAAMRFLYAEHGLVAEGAGAVAVAAVRAGRITVRTGACAAVVTGRNVAGSRYASVLG